MSAATSAQPTTQAQAQAPAAATAPATETVAPATTTTTADVPAAADNVIKPTEPAAAAAAQTAATDAAATAAASKSAEEGRRLYIGNLAYAATEAELKDFFKEYTVESTSIPMNPRTNRPVGYAFVDLASVEQAQAAIAALSGNEILERKVSVQVAQKPDLHKDGDGEGRKRGQNRTRGRGRGRGGRLGRSGRRNQQNSEQNGDAAQSGNEQAAATTAPLADSTNEGNVQSEHAKDQSKPRRAPRHRGPPEDGIPSKTKVMVANLPYDLNEDKLKEIFAAYNPVSVKVALRPIPRFMVKKLQARNEPRKGRGFGFVTLANEEMQQKAVKEMSGKEIEGREIAVKVAIDSPGKEDHEEGDNAAANGEKKEEVKEKAADVAAPAATAGATGAPAAAPAAAGTAAAAAPAPATAAPAAAPAAVDVGEKKEAAPAAATA